MLNVYTDTNFIKAHSKGEKFPLIYALLFDERNEFPEVKNYYQIVENIQEAEVAFLPFSWNYYLNNNLQSEAERFINQCYTINLKVLTYVSGDEGVMPTNKDVYVFRNSGYKSKKLANQIAFPAFFKDPLVHYIEKENHQVRIKGEKPVIGFVGQATPNLLKAAKDIGLIVYRNLKYHLGKSLLEPQQWFAAPFMRYKYLKRLEKNTKIETNIIYRQRYRAGVRKNRSVDKTTYEFYENLNDSDYIFNLRGAGNFSVRFYQTLAMGRIPVLIDTDCLLPLEGIIDWTQHCIRIPQGKEHEMEQRLLEFHQNLTQEQFEHIQKENRKLWEEYLTLTAFFARIHDLLKNGKL
ncbi:exostosin family protein [Kordia sp. YSTF-M3]|uniref:Exostosin family protein n=1 Tax=Kordia aestuariivivens TaxID=2759037 RepID=A0ABR7Q992_9FLAO|nr:exostosin family protein [Kordia aestuariivivens]MBC8755126.1 exostosin family protein [Kordia aestuariivivens]